MDFFLKKHPFVFSVAAITVLFMLFFSFLTPQFMRNDDPIMAMLASGYFNDGSPDEHIVHTNVLIGKILKFLFTVCPDYNWYTIYLYACYFISTVFIVYSFLLYRPGIYRVFLFFAGFMSLEIYALLYPTFTIAAVTLALSGILVAISVTDRKRRDSKYFLLAAALIILAGLVRKHSAFMVIAIATPVMIAVSLQRRSFKIVLLVVIAMALIYAAIQYDKSYYLKDTDWGNYYVWKETFPDVIQRLAYDTENGELFGKAGWSRNDYMMFKSFFLWDKKLYSVEKFKLIGTELHLRWPRESIKAFTNVVSKVKLFILAAIAVFFLAVPWKNSYFVITALASMALTAYLLFTYYIPLQAIVAIGLTLGYIGLFFAGDADIKKYKNIVLFAAAILIFTWTYQLHTYSRSNVAHQESTTRALQSMSKGKALYVTWGTAFPYEGIDVFTGLSSLRGVDLYPLGWDEQSPASENMLKKHGITDLYKALYERNDVLLVAFESYLPFFTEFVREHHGVFVLYSAVEEHGEGVTKKGIYRLFKMP